MNDHHKLNAHGLDLLTYFEKGDASVVPLTPGGAAMEPYVCPGGELTIGYGCTKWFGGRDVEATDRISDEASARTLLAEQVVEYEEAVRKWVTVPLNSNQFSALTCFAFNVGIKAMSGSTLLRHINASRFDDAAEAFGMWIFATSGQHKRALRGLLRRRYAEALLGMGYAFEEACDDEFIRLKVRRPPNNIGTDQVEFKTPFKEVLIIAQRYPLPPLDDELILTQPASPRAADEAAQQPANPARNPAAGAAPAIEKPVSNGPAPATPPVKIPAPQRAPEGSVVLPSQKVDTKPPAPDLPVATKLPPYAPPAPNVPGPVSPQLPPAPPNMKKLEKSRRYWGLAIFHGGRLLMILGATTLPGTFAVTFGHVYGAVVADPQLFSAIVNSLAFTTGLVMDTVGGWLHKRGGNRASSVLVAGNEPPEAVTSK